MLHQIGQFLRRGSCTEGICLKEPWCCAIDKGVLLETELAHDPDRVVFHTGGESWRTSSRMSRVLKKTVNGSAIEGMMRQVTVSSVSPDSLSYSSLTLLTVLAWPLLQ